MRITTTVDLVDFSRDHVDCAIRFGKGEWANTDAAFLFSEELTPVCSPLLTEGKTPLNTLGDLSNHALLHARLRPDDWRIWLSTQGSNTIDSTPTSGNVYETRNYALQAAIEGLGVAITDPRLIDNELKTRRLIRPFSEFTSVDGGYYFVCPKHRTDEPNIEMFRNWLIDEIGGLSP